MYDRETIKAIIAHELYAESLDDSDLFSELTIDDIDFIYVRMAIEIKLGIIICEDNLFNKYPTVGEFVDMVMSR